MDKPYPTAVKNFCNSSLLHLYISCAETSRFVPLRKRNECLIKYLKPQLVKTEYKALKKDIKTLIIGGKKQTADLEKQIIKLRGMVDNFDNDVENFYSLLSVFEDELQIPSSILKNPKYTEQICISEQCIDEGFDKSGRKITPLRFTVYSDRWPMIEPLVKQHGQFILEVKESSDSEAIMFLHDK